ncbi:MAG: hypothetical protein V3V17_12340 [Alphaproteobacteria bacterium]
MTQQPIAARSRPVRRLVTALAAGILAISGAAVTGSAPAGAVSFEVPDGFFVEQPGRFPAIEDWHPLLTIRPPEGPFSGLSAIHLREVDGEVEEPDLWLKRRLTGDVGSSEPLEEMFSSLDSPFGDPFFDALRQAIPELYAAMQKIADLPLEFCDDPQTGYNASGAFREIYCVYNIGPIREYLVLRLQKADRTWYFTEIRTMNEQRLRQLIGIANSFDSGD